MGEPAGCPGAPAGGHQARNTDRRARGNSVRPSGRGPQRSGLWTGSYPKDRRRHEQPAPTLPPARPHARTPAPTATTPRQRPHPPRPAPWPFSRSRDHPPDAMACGDSVGARQSAPGRFTTTSATTPQNHRQAPSRQVCITFAAGTAPCPRGIERIRDNSPPATLLDLADRILTGPARTGMRPCGISCCSSLWCRSCTP
jgi:hypothetical protein